MQIAHLTRTMTPQNNSSAQIYSLPDPPLLIDVKILHYSNKFHIITIQSAIFPVDYCNYKDD